MYYREYRTKFHIVTYGISESRVCEIIKEIENILIQDKRFHLPVIKVCLSCTVIVKFLKRKAKRILLSKADKKQNHTLSSSRVVIENVIREVKIFRIVAEKYRNRRKRFGLRFNVMAAIYNL